jgi:peptide/nickel transport system permease protein
VATVALGFLAVAASVGAPLAEAIQGHGPNDQFPYAVSTTGKPIGPLTRVYDAPFAPADVYGVEFLPPPPGTGTKLFVLGADNLCRDQLLRLLYGARVTLIVALGAMLVALALGILFGTIAGWVGGLVDAAVSRFTDLVMAIPYLFLLIVIGSAANDTVADITLGGLLNEGVLQLILLIGAFTWFYPARIVRSRVLALRTEEFVEAAQMVGAAPGRIARTHVLPHLIPPLLVYAAFAVATNVMIEVGVTFFGAGVKLPTASWGSMLSSSWGVALRPVGYDISAEAPINFQPWLTIIPSIAIFVTVFALNQLADGLRDALDPKGRRA